MTPTTYRWMFLAWPLVCGLIVGGLVGAITGSLSLFALVGTFVAVIVFGALRGHAFVSAPKRAKDDWFLNPAYSDLPGNIYNSE